MSRACILAVALAACGTENGSTSLPFPDDYASTYTEVRNCRSSSDHELHKIRVLASPDAVAPYNDRTAFPVGSVVVKEEYDFADDCTGEILEWTVMVKTASSADLGWEWTRIGGDKKVGPDETADCLECHSQCNSPPESFDGTCTNPP